MTGFSADWLALRADADDRARDDAIMKAAIGLAAEPGSTITDLGGGSGATMRVLGPHLPHARWRILDIAPDLLSLIPASESVATAVTDLAASPEAAFVGAPSLITASAFFDLVSIDWLDRFIPLLAQHRTPLYAALTYDGLETWTPKPPFEDYALAAFHDDMRSNKGFGRGLGADAAAVLEKLLTHAGFEVTMARSPWQLERPRDAALIDALADGGAQALGVSRPSPHHAAWHQGRRRALNVNVGHVDILARPKP
jgi:hypothetical protein